MMAERLLICGASTRAAAESAARCGFRVTAVDGFADLDQHPSVHALSARRDLHVAPNAQAMARVTRGFERDAVVYLSPFENDPRAVATLSGRGTLWGNTPDTLRRVRDPFVLASVLRGHGFTVPRLSNGSNVSNVSNDSNDSNVPNAWLVKPFRSGGGNRVRRWRGEPVPKTAYLQEHIEGVPGSIVFVAGGGRCVPLAFSRQIVGDPNFGAEGFRYCGSIFASPDDPQFTYGGTLFAAAQDLARCVSPEFGLVGLNGIDFVARNGVPYPLEVNPRWPSSIELAERAFSTAFFAAHAAACAGGALPTFDLATASRHRGAVGKAVVYARHSGSVGDTSAWLDAPDVRDVPQSGELVRAGQPVCTVFASAADSQACYLRLADRAARIYTELQQSGSFRLRAEAT